jgi:hypothetical protein
VTYEPDLGTSKTLPGLICAMSNNESQDLFSVRCGFPLVPKLELGNEGGVRGGGQASGCYNGWPLICVVGRSMPSPQDDALAAATTFCFNSHWRPHPKARKPSSMRTAQFFLFACALLTAEGNASAQEYQIQLDRPEKVGNEYKVSLKSVTTLHIVPVKGKKPLLPDFLKSA